MAHPHDGNSIVGGGSPVIGQEGLDYYLGVGHLNNRILAEGLDNDVIGMQATTGDLTLDRLTQMLANPTSGVMGLAAAARYGGPAGIMSKTGGGIDMSDYQSIFRSLVDSQTEFALGLNSQPEDIPLVEHDGSQTPGGSQTPASSTPAQAPLVDSPLGGPQIPANVLDRTDWDFYLNEGQGNGQGYTHAADGNAVRRGTPALPTGGNTDWGAYIPGAPTGGNTDYGPYIDDIMGRLGGGKVPLKGYAGGGQVDLSQFTDEQLNAYGGRDIIEATRRLGPQGAQTFVSQMQNLGALWNVVPSDTRARAGDRQGLFSLPPHILNGLMREAAAKLPHPGVAAPRPILGASPVQLKSGGTMKLVESYAKGGSLVVSGEPHFIVDSKGKPVAALSEDGKPELIEGVPGGVEVIPLDPMRNALYESRKQQTEMANTIATMEEELQPTQKVDPNQVPMMTPTDAAKIPNTMPGAIAQLQVGGYQMLPEQWHGGGSAGPVKLPTQSGSTQTRAEQVGPREDMITEIDGKAASYDDLLADLDPGSEEWGQKYAKLFGSYMSDFGSQAVSGDIVKSLNQGEAGGKLINQTAFATMDAGAQADYTQMLVGMGIVRSPEHLRETQRQFAPTAMGSVR